MAQDKRDVLLTAKISKPVPGEDTFHGNDNVIPEGGNGFEEDVRIGLYIPMKNNLPFLVKDTKIHRSGVKIDTAVKFVLIGVKSHLRPPLRKIGFLTHT
jgi:hypothetical protein